MSKIVNYTATAIFVVLIFYLLFIGKDLLLPLVIAIVLWYLIITLGNSFSLIKIGTFSLPKSVCTVASFLTFIGLIWLLVNFLSSNMDDVLEVAPIYQENLTTRLQSFSFFDANEFEGCLLYTSDAADE